MKAILAQLFTVAILFSCQSWVDDHTRFMECEPLEVGKVVCNNDQGFNICWISLRWEKLIDCDEIDHFIVSDYFTWSEFVQDYDIEYNKYLECCK